MKNYELISLQENVLLKPFNENQNDNNSVRNVPKEMFKNNVTVELFNNLKPVLESTKDSLDMILKYRESTQLPKVLTFIVNDLEINNTITKPTLESTLKEDLNNNKISMKKTSKPSPNMKF